MPFKSFLLAIAVCLMTFSGYLSKAQTAGSPTKSDTCEDYQLHMLSRFNPCQVKAMALQQVAQSFAQKFSVVTSDIDALSNTNLEALSRVLPLEASDHQRAQEIDQNFVVVHSTTTASATAILNSGELLSLDELARRKILSPSRKAKAMTGVTTDGRIGEQDVIYFALQERSGSGSYGFGEVTFHFDKSKILNTGYFTLNSFSVGATSTFAEQESNPSAEIDRYRPMVFKGYETYLRLLAMSDQVLDKYENYLPKFTQLADEILSRHDVLIRSAMERSNRSQTKYTPPPLPAEEKSLDFCGLLAQVNSWSLEACRSNPLNEYAKLIVIKNLRTLSEKKTRLSKIVAGYTLFPMYTNREPTLLRPAHWFWELKIPAAYKLEESLQSVSFATQLVTTVATNNGGIQTSEIQYRKLDTAALEKAIGDYALKRGLKLTRTNDLKNNRVTVTFR